MNDLISRQAVIDALLSEPPEPRYPDWWVRKVMEIEPRRGEWIEGHCSKCGCDVPAYIINWKWQKDMDANYCPNCGAYMGKTKGESNK